MKRSVLACLLAVSISSTGVALAASPASASPKPPTRSASQPAPGKGEAGPLSALDFPGNRYAPMERGDELVRVGSGDEASRHGLISGGIPPDNSYGEIESGQGMALLFQADGNLVEYDTASGVALFSTGTSTGARLIYQDDGNVVLYDEAGRALWATGTAGNTDGVGFGPYGNGQLLIQADDGSVVFSTGPAVTPLPGVLVAAAYGFGTYYSMLVQNDGNVVVYDDRNYSHSQPPTPVWSTGTAGAGRVRFVAQSDGNLVLYAVPSGRVVWATGSSGPEAYYQLDMQPDRNLVLYLTDGQTRLRAVWASNTAL